MYGGGLTWPLIDLDLFIAQRLVVAINSRPGLRCHSDFTRHSRVVADRISKGDRSYSPVCPLSLDLDLCVHVGHDHSSLGIESQGHRSRSWVRFSEVATWLYPGEPLRAHVIVALPMACLVAIFCKITSSTKP